MAQSQRQRPDLDYQIGRQTLPSRNLQTHKGISSRHAHWSAPTTPTSRHFYDYEYHDLHFENEKKSIIKRAKEKAKRWRYSILRRKRNKYEKDNKPQVSSGEMDEHGIDENHGAANYRLTREEDSTIRYQSSNSNPTRITSEANENWEIETKQANDVAKQPSIAYCPPKATKSMVFPSTTNITRMDDKHMNQASANTTLTLMGNDKMNQAPANITLIDNDNRNQASKEHNNSEKMMLPPPTTISANPCSLFNQTKMKSVNLETTASTSIANGYNTNGGTKTLDPITTSLPSTTNDHKKGSPSATSITPLSTSVVNGHRISIEKEMLSPVTIIASAPATDGYETINEPLIDTSFLSGTTSSTSIASDHKNIDDVKTLSPSPTSLGFVNSHKTIDEAVTLSQSLMSFGSIVNGHKTIGETLIKTLAPAYTMALEATIIIASKIQESCPRIEIVKKQVWNRGVSIKEYLMNKLEPNDEDRALCDVITEAVSLLKYLNRSIAEIGQVDASTKGIVTSSIAKGVVSSSVKEEKHDFNSTLPISTNPFIEEFEIRRRTH